MKTYKIFFRVYGLETHEMITLVEAESYLKAFEVGFEKILSLYPADIDNNRIPFITNVEKVEE